MAGRICVLASGSGSLLQALIDSPLRPSIIAVVTDRHQVAAVERAEAAAIDAFVIDPHTFPDRCAWDLELLHQLQSISPDLIVGAGFMRIMGPLAVGAFRGRIINAHPALLPSFPGAHAVRDALAYGVTITGSTIHYIDEGVDTGAIIAQQAVAVLPGDDESTLHERIKKVERELLVSVVSELMKERT